MQPSLSIIVPVYNEGKTVADIMVTLAAVWPDAQVIYVDDGSKDQSLAMLRANARPQDLVLTKPNGGKGSAIAMGLAQAAGTFTTIQDADLEYHPSQIATLAAQGVSHPDCCIFGSRFLRANPNIYKRYLLGNKVLTGITNLLFGSRLTDSYTCRKLLPTPLFQSLNLQSQGFEMEAEICAKCLRRGIRIIELPIEYKPRTIEEGKKINWRDAVKGVWMLLKIRIGLL